MRSLARDKQRMVADRKSGLGSLVTSIEDPLLRQYCAEQLKAANSPTEIDATVRLMFELVSMPAAVNAN